MKQQAKLPSGGIPDIVALDKFGRVVVFEVKRDVDRRQLAQCLEYAGWARTANLDELAQMYHGGQQGFWSDWQDFTDSATPVVVNPNPRLVLVARDFQQRTESAFEFLVENNVPVTLVRVTIYVDKSGRRFVDVEGDHEIEISAGGEQKDTTTDYTRINGKAIKLADLLDAGILEEGYPWSGYVRRRVSTTRRGSFLTAPSNSQTAASSVPHHGPPLRQQKYPLSTAGPLGRCREWARNSTVFARIFMTQ